jgi:hypothetical protein
MLRTVTVKLKDRLLAEIEAEARARRTTRSAVVRARLERPAAPGSASGLHTRPRHSPRVRAAIRTLANKAHLVGYGGSRRR